MEEKLNNYKVKNYGYSAKYVVLDSLKSGPKTTREISKIVNRTKRTVQAHLENLKKDNLVKFRKLKRKFVYKFLWDIK